MARRAANPGPDRTPGRAAGKDCLEAGQAARERLDAVLALIDEWIEEDKGSGDQEWRWLKRALDADRPSNRKLFSDE